MNLIDIFHQQSPPDDARDNLGFLDLWALRALKSSGTYGRLLRRIGKGYEGIRRLLTIEDGNEPKCVAELATMVDERLVVVAAQAPSLPAAIATNIRLLGQHVHLTPIEQSVLLARALLRTSEAWEDTVNLVGGSFLSDAKLARMLGAAFVCPPTDVADALRPDGPLRAVGLLEMDPRLGMFECRLIPLGGLPNALLRDNTGVDELIEFAASRAPAAVLRLQAYPHLQDEIAVISDFLRGAAACGLQGVNILLHGPPGTGKTELVRAMAESLNWKLYEVAAEGSRDEGEAGPEARFARYRFLQRLLSRSHGTALIFDEIEDVFPGATFGEARPKIPKAQINRLLETNAIPTFWVSNRIRQLDQAYLRRFDLIVEVGSPPRSVRKRVLEDALDQVGMNCATIDRVAAARALTPAALARAAKVVSHAEVDRTAAVNRLELVLKGYREVARVGDEEGALVLPQYYDLDLVNASEPLASVSNALARFGRGRVLLHGPPGTGKTAFANYVARQLDRPLLLKRASDIFDHWLGESEKNARRMFEEAKQEHAILFLDEADSVLRDRDGAVGRWEAPVVNEILTGMERFSGVFICATNMLDVLDAASLRRFTFKIRLDWLNADQCWRLLEATFPQVAAQADDIERCHAKVAMARLGNLAPGDFAVVRDRAELGITVDSLEAVINELASESLIKPGAARSIGF